MLLIRGHLSSFLKVGQSKHSWHFHWAWATPMKWFLPDKKSNLIIFSPLISGIVEAISGWSSSMIKIQNRSRCDDVVVAINLFFSKRIEKLTTEWDSLGRPSPICPTHPPGGTQQLKTPEWCWLAIKSNKKSMKTNGYCLPIAAVLGNSSFPGIVLGGAESNRAVCWSSWEATTRSRSCKKEILMRCLKEDRSILTCHSDHVLGNEWRMRMEGLLNQLQSRS